MIKQKTLREVSTFIRTGKTPPTIETKYFEGEVNWYTPGDLDQGKHLFKSRRTLTTLAFDDKKAVVFPVNTLLVGCIGDIGKIGITTEKCSSNQQLTGIYPNENTDVNYLYYWFRCNKKTLESISNNAVVPILNNRTLETIKIPLPPLPQQQKIANILDAADALRQKDKALLAKYDELTEALFLDMFGDPVSNPKGWEKVELKKLVIFENGDRSSNYPSGDDILDAGVLFVNSKNIKKNYFEENITSFISVEKFKSLSRGKLEKEDLIISLRGSIGNCCIFKGKYDTGFINAQLMIIRAADKINNVFLFSYLTNNHIQAVLKNLSQGAAVPQLTSKQLGLFLIPNPPISLQNQFAERINLIEHQKAVAQKSLDKSEQLFNSLLQKAFKGELI